MVLLGGHGVVLGCSGVMLELQWGDARGAVGCS